MISEPPCKSVYIEAFCCENTRLTPAAAPAFVCGSFFSREKKKKNPKNGSRLVWWSLFMFSKIHKLLLGDYSTQYAYVVLISQIIFY